MTDATPAVVAKSFAQISASCGASKAKSSGTNSRKAFVDLPELRFASSTASASNLLVGGDVVSICSCISCLGDASEPTKVGGAASTETGKTGVKALLVAAACCAR